MGTFGRTCTESSKKKKTYCGRPVGEYIISSMKIFTFKTLSAYQPPESSWNEIVAHTYIYHSWRVSLVTSNLDSEDGWENCDGKQIREKGNNEGGRERKLSYDRGECLWGIIVNLSK